MFDLQENQSQFNNPVHHWRTRLMVLLHVKPPPRRCLFIYVNLSQCVPAVAAMSVSFRFLKPMIFNTATQWRNRQATGSILALGPRVLRCLAGSAESHHGCHGCLSFVHCRRSQSGGFERFSAWKVRQRGKRRHVVDGGLVGSGPSVSN